MTFRDRIMLVLKGKPIQSFYKIMDTEDSFRNRIKAKILPEDAMNPFSLKKEKFVGQFHGYYRREISIKPKSSIWKSGAIPNSIWIHGKIEPESENEMNFTVTFHRTSFSKKAQKTLVGIFGLMFLIGCFQMLKDNDFKSLLIFGLAILFFYTSATLIMVSQAKDQIDYFEKYFFQGFHKNVVIKKWI